MEESSLPKDATRTGCLVLLERLGRRQVNWGPGPGPDKHKLNPGPGPANYLQVLL